MKVIRYFSIFFLISLAVSIRVSAQYNGSVSGEYKSREWKLGGVYIRPTYGSFDAITYEHVKKVEKRYDYKEIYYIHPEDTLDANKDSLQIIELNYHFRKNLGLLLIPIKEYIKKTERNSTEPAYEEDTEALINKIIEGTAQVRNVTQRANVARNIGGEAIYFIDVDYFKTDSVFFESLREMYDEYIASISRQGRNFDYYMRHMEGKKDAYAILTMEDITLVISNTFRGLLYAKNELLESLRNNKLPDELIGERVFETTDTLRVANLYQNYFENDRPSNTQTEYLDNIWNTTTTDPNKVSFTELSRALNNMKFNTFAFPIPPPGTAEQGYLLKGSDATVQDMSMSMERNDIDFYISVNLYTLIERTRELNDFLSRNSDYIDGVIIEASEIFHNDKRYKEGLFPSIDFSLGCEAAENIVTQHDLPVVWRDGELNQRPCVRDMDDSIILQRVRENNDHIRDRDLIKYLTITWYSDEIEEREKSVLLYFHTQPGRKFFTDIRTD